VKAAAAGTVVAHTTGREVLEMKKILATILSLTLLAAVAMPAAAQGRYRYRTSRATQSRYYDYELRDNRSFWEKHRDKITTAGGVLGGAILGSLIGGRKGALIGAIAGGAGSAVYTYKIRNRYRRW
jgi:opacity protein-like surface antigen